MYSVGKTTFQFMFIIARNIKKEIHLRWIRGVFLFYYNTVQYYCLPPISKRSMEYRNEVQLGMFGKVRQLQQQMQNRVRFDIWWEVDSSSVSVQGHNSWNFYQLNLDQISRHIKKGTRQSKVNKIVRGISHQKNWKLENILKIPLQYNSIERNCKYWLCSKFS